MQKTEIYSDKKKALFIVSLSLVFGVLGIWMILEAENIKTPILRNPLLIRIVGISGVLFSGFGMFVMAKQLFRRLIKKQRKVHLYQYQHLRFIVEEYTKHLNPKIKLHEKYIFFNPIRTITAFSKFSDQRFP